MYTLNGGCSSPIAAYAVIKEGELQLTGLYATEGSMDYVTGKITGSPEKAKELGKKLAEQLKNIKSGE